MHIHVFSMAHFPLFELLQTLKLVVTKKIIHKETEKWKKPFLRQTEEMFKKQRKSF